MAKRKKTPPEETSDLAQTPSEAYQAGLQKHWEHGLTWLSVQRWNGHAWADENPPRRYNAPSVDALFALYPGGARLKLRILREGAGAAVKTVATYVLDIPATREEGAEMSQGPVVEMLMEQIKDLTERLEKSEKSEAKPATEWDRWMDYHEAQLERERQSNQSFTRMLQDQQSQLMESLQSILTTRQEPMDYGRPAGDEQSAQMLTLFAQMMGQQAQSQSALVGALLDRQLNTPDKDDWLKDAMKAQLLEKSQTSDSMKQFKEFLELKEMLSDGGGGGGGDKGIVEQLAPLVAAFGARQQPPALEEAPQASPRMAMIAPPEPARAVSARSSAPPPPAQPEPPAQNGIEFAGPEAPLLEQIEKASHSAAYCIRHGIEPATYIEQAPESSLMLLKGIEKEALIEAVCAVDGSVAVKRSAPAWITQATALF